MCREDDALIAIVDDEASLREATESLLKSIGFAAETFASAEEFLRSGCGLRASCVVLDVRLPGISGLDLQRYLASLRHPIPIVFMSAHADGRIEAEALDAGASAFLRKPFVGDDLIGAIRKGLRTYTNDQYPVAAPQPSLESRFQLDPRGAQSGHHDRKL
jgi:FixJ family two-component response regulator